MEQNIIDKLKGNVPDVVFNQLSPTIIKFNINNILRLSHFISQCDHESANFTAVKENLNYSADGLKKTFGKYFPNNLNVNYAKNTEKIANRVYSNRMGNGDELSGDGYKYSGRGYIMLTGKVNYIQFGKFINTDLLSNPGLVATKYALMSAAFFFETNKLWTICDKGSDIKTITEISLRINGGTNGLSDRINKFNKYYNILSK